eukprot:gene2848-5603_t
MNVTFLGVGNAIHAVSVCDATPQSELGVAYGQDFWLERAQGLPFALFAQARRRYELPGSHADWTAAELRRKAALIFAPPACAAVRKEFRPPPRRTVAATLQPSEFSRTAQQAYDHSAEAKSLQDAAEWVGNAIHAVSVCDATPQSELGVAYGQDFWLERAQGLPFALFAQARRRYELPGSHADWTAAELRRKAALIFAPPACAAVRKEFRPPPRRTVAATLQPSEFSRTAQQAYDHSAEAKSLQDAAEW